MLNNHQGRVTWGGPSAFFSFFACVTVIGVGAAAHWRALDLVFALAWVGFLAFGSLVVLWRNWKHRAEIGPARLGQLNALPRSWQRWMRGESGDDRSR